MIWDPGKVIFGLVTGGEPQFFWTPNAKKHDFGYPKNGTSGAQNKNLTPHLESVTKTDSKTGFEFKF